MIFLDRKYVALLSSQLSQFKQKSNDLFVFRCPICGDSQKNKYKARGYIFPAKDSLVFKCHNCGDSRSFGNLLSHVSPALYADYIKDRYLANDPKSQNEKTLLDHKFDAPTFVSDTPYEILNKLTGVHRIKDLPNDHIARRYLEIRKIPKSHWVKIFFIEDEHELEALSPKYKDRIPEHDPRIILPTTNIQIFRCI